MWKLERFWESWKLSPNRIEDIPVVIFIEQCCEPFNLGNVLSTVSVNTAAYITADVGNLLTESRLRIYSREN